MLWSLIQMELFKIRKTRIWLLLFVSPIISASAGFSAAGMEEGQNEWSGTFLAMVLVHAPLWLPLIIGVFCSFICRFEHQSGGWKQLLSLPVKRTQVYLSKFVIVALLIAVNQLLFGASWILVGVLKHFTDPIPNEILLKSLFGGWISTFPLAALLLWISMAWSSFAAPLALNVILTLPNILVANSEKFAPFYPWVQPFLTMIPKDNGAWGGFFLSNESIIFVIVGGFLLFFAGGFLYIQKKAV